MIRLLIAAALGYAAYRIVEETVASIPRDFEPMPDAPRQTAARASRAARRA